MSGGKRGRVNVLGSVTPVCQATDGCPPQNGGAMKRQKFCMVMGVSLLITSWSVAALTPVRIQMESWSPYYVPAAATVTARYPVRWENPTATHHTVTHDGCREEGPCLFDSGSIPPAGVYEIPGLPPGRYPYHCTVHPIMRGTIVVTNADHSSEI